MSSWSEECVAPSKKVPGLNPRGARNFVVRSLHVVSEYSSFLPQPINGKATPLKVVHKEGSKEPLCPLLVKAN